ncbi:MAG: hypothetical protein NXI20_15580 [bacterium]|nr:hypothetical protein [bacterium]
MDLIIMASVPALMLFISLILFSEKKGLKVVEGGLYTIKNAKGQYGMLKVLKIEDNSVLHSLVFRQMFHTRPKRVQFSALSTKPRYIKIEKRKFSKWYAELLGTMEVKPREITRYLGS